MAIWRFVLARALAALATLWAINTVVFLLARGTGDAAALLMPVDASPEQVLAMRVQLGLDRSLPGQYLHYLAGLLHGDMGASFRTREAVAPLVWGRTLVSLQLSAVGLAFALVTAIPLGVLAAVHRGRAVDHAVRLLAFLGQAAPSFFVGLLLVQYVAAHVSWLPSGGNDGWAGVLLPGLTLGIFLMASITRLLRTSMIEALGSDYVRMARLKGLPERAVVWRHALKNALLPVMALTGMYAALSVTVSVAIEVVFAWPGLGQLSFDAIVNRDLAVLQAVVIVASALTVAASLLVDALSAFVDPRVRGGEESP